MRIIEPIIVIAGATATGKTAAAVTVAEGMSGEIISADSMQVYKYMNIGTAKPTAEEKRGIPHHMLDVLRPDEGFSVAAYRSMAESCLKDIQKRGKVPVIAGGTGFYINALIKAADFSEGAGNPKLREYYCSLAESRGKGYVYGLLERADPLSAGKIHPNNVKRVIRALEYYETTGNSIALHNSSEKAKTVNDGICLFVLEMNRERLYDKINLRVDKMMSDGLLREVESLLEMGYGGGLTAMQAIGYKEIVRHLKGEYTLEEAIGKIKQATRNYAKRQITWFKHQTNGMPVDAEAAARDGHKLTELVKNEIKRRQNAEKQNT